MTMPPMTPVLSSSLSAVGYDAAKSQLFIAFRDGTRYQYFVVPLAIFKELMAADSHGQYFDRFIRNRFPYQRVR